MGVPKFFRYMSERYPCLSELVKEYQIPEFDNLYLDMNGIIHMCSHPNDFDPHFRISEEKIFKDIFHYIEILFRMIQPQKLFFMAVDGVAPRAKMNQQRGRRFRSAKEAEVLEAKAKEKGEVLPKEARFDSNCITPGTVFMARLNEQLKYFVTYKISTDKLWQKCKVILSGHETPGEGEHKIMDYIRYMKAQPGYDSNTRHCLYGLDADLIILGLCTHEPHFSLLREEVKFGKNQKRISTPEETTFFLLHLSLMREYIEHEFSPVKDKLSFEFDIEKVIDDWVLMGFLVGNDFIPHLPNLHISNGVLPILYQAYMEVLPTLDGYINEAGTLRLDRFEKFMERLSVLDKVQFSEHYADLKYFESKTGRRPNEMERTSYKKSESTPDASPKKSASRDLEALIKSTDAMLVGSSDDEKPLDVDDDSDDNVYNMEFVQHKRDYYMNKLEYKNVDADVMCSQAECYVRAIQWNLHYYYNGCCSWSWYYPHHYAPYISDIKDFKDLKLEFDMGVPFLPFQQLLAVLPAASKNLLPEPFQALMTGGASSIIDYYPIDFKTDLNGKRQEWEAVVLIPFIDEKRLLDAMEPCYTQLTPDEMKRNSHGPMYDFTYSEESMGPYDAPEYFPRISMNHAKLVLVERDDILVPEDKLIKGACPGVKLDVYYPGFPTMKHIKHTSSLQKAKVKVFEQPSRGENMILEILPQDMPSLIDLANEILGKSIFVSWPHLIEAQVIAISNREYRMNIANPSSNSTESFSKEEVKGALATQWNIQKKSIAENYKNRLGVEVGETEILVHARPISGRRYIFGTQGKMTLEKQWCEIPLAYALQATVRNLTVHDPHFVQFKNINEVFTPKSICFMLGHPHYGAMGEVVEAGANLKSGRVKVAMWIMQEPNLDRIKQAQAEFRTRFMHGSIAAQRLGITSHLLSRITGTIYVMQGPKEQLENPKHNVGLNLKFNKKNEEVPGYTRKDNGQWLYSVKAVDLIRAYMQTCPGLFEQLARNVSNDVFHEDDLFPEGSEELNRILTWLKEQPFYSIERRACGAEGLEVELVQEIEKEVDEFLQHQSNAQTGKTVMMQVKPHLLYKPSLNSGNLPPDAKAVHRIYDRIVNIRESFTVPLGYKGTIVGIQKAENILDYMYDVVFDKPFAGGLTLNICSTNRGYRLSAPGFINLSHGIRAESVKAGKPNMDTPHTESWRTPKHSQNHSPHPNTSAFAPFNNQGGFAPAFFKSNQSAPPQQMKIMKKNNEQPSPNQHTTQQNTDVKKKVQQSMTQHATKAVTNPNVGISARPSSQVNAQKQSEQTSEFQALWNELHNLQKSSGASQKPSAIQNTELKQSTSTSADSPQDPSAFLKAMLKISDDKSQNTPPNKPPAFPQLSKPADAPVLVQQLFDHARQAESKKEDMSYCATLLTYSQLKGMGMPRYTYLTNKETNLVCAEVILPDMRKFVGDFCPTSELAAESAAKKVYTTLNLDKAPKPAINILPTPPRQWYNTPQNTIRPQNVRPMMNGPPQGPPPMPMNTPNPFMRAFNGSPKMQQHQNAPHLMPNFGQNRSQQRHFLAAQNTSKNWRTDNKSDLRRSAPFVPLQAQKQTRNLNNRHSTGSTNKGSNEAPQQKFQPEKSQQATSKGKNEDKAAKSEQEQSQSRSGQNNPKPQRSAKERKSRIAANFGSAPMTNGGEPQ